MDKGAAFRRLHDTIFVMPNPSDLGMAKLLAHCGFKALATSSAGFAWTRGLQDGGVGFEAAIAHCKEMAAATDLPVSGDLEMGKGDSAESAGETVFAAEAAGLAGCSIEDHTGEAARPIYDFNHAVERVAAAAEAARAAETGLRAYRADREFSLGPSGFRRHDQAAAGLRSGWRGCAVCAWRLRYGSGRGNLRGADTSGERAGGRAAFYRRRIWRKQAPSAFRSAPRLTNYAYGAVERAAREILEAGTFEFNRDVMPSARIADILAGKTA